MRRSRIGKLCKLGAFLIALAMTRGASAGPTPVISAISTQGMAPFAVHVHCLNSTYTVGDRLSSLLQWDFGDANGIYNKLTGFNAAHLYEHAGTYTLKLSITDQNGTKVSTTRQITVLPSNRATIYVSAAGNDNNSGSSTSSPIKTMAKAAAMLANDRAILLRRGDTFNVPSSFQISQTNVLVGAYGSGDRPVLNWTGSGIYMPLIKMGESAQSVVVEHLKFDCASSPPTESSPRGIHPNGTNITVRDCRFGNLSDAMNAAAGVNGWLVQQNAAQVLGGYFIWDQGTDHTILGNTAAGSYNEHTIRLGGADRVLIARNNLTNTAKSNIWCMLGNDAYLARNKIHKGRILVGPNFAVGSPSERFKRAVAEANEIFDEGIILYSGAEHVVIRNNVLHSNPLDCLSVWGYYGPMNRTVDDVRICNNTGTNTSAQYGRFAKIGAGATNILAANNLYVAPLLNTGYGASNITSGDGSLGSDAFDHNLWSKPHAGVPVHFMADVGVTMTQWAAQGQCTSEKYRACASSDLDANNVPQFDANLGHPVTGVFTDYLGHYRPAGNVWSVGAVELNPASGPFGPPLLPEDIVLNESVDELSIDDPGAGSDSSSLNQLADLNGDGVVDASDLFILVNQWGYCPDPCHSDLNGDGLVNSDDLLSMINQWSS